MSNITSKSNRDGNAKTSITGQIVLFGRVEWKMIVLFLVINN
jgi:hypothetical protein